MYRNLNKYQIKTFGEQSKNDLEADLKAFAALLRHQ